WRGRRVRIRRFGPVGKLIWKSVVPAPLDHVQLLRRILVGPVIRGDHPAGFVPAEAVGISQPTREHFDLWRIAVWIHPPDAGGDRCLAFARNMRIVSGLTAIGA